MEMKKLFLIDGHALIFKMHYAFLRRPMINSKGVDTSILFGFTKYILELIEKEKPEYMAIAFDPPGGTFRNELYKEYKANRAETPQLVINALEPLKEICIAMEIPVLMVPGFEADDVIGSMAKRSASEGLEVYMVTPDKDYGQLITDRIFQYKPGKAGGDNEILGVNEICKKYNIVRPSQVIDILTICGDSSDNVPGVYGVGEVGAGKLISQYGTVANIYAHIDELPAKLRFKFTEAQSHIGLSNRLVTIKTDIPLSVTKEEMELNTNFGPEVIDLFKKYEFNSLLKYLGIKKTDISTAKSGEIILSDYNAILSKIEKNSQAGIIIEGFNDSIFSAVKRIYIGTEDEGKCYGCLFPTEEIGKLQPILTDENIEKFGYNLKYQQNILAKSNIDLKGKFYDIELLHYIINPEKSHKLNILSEAYLNIELEEGEKIVSGSLFEEEDEQSDTKIKAAAVLVTLGKKILNELTLNSLTKLYDNIEEPLLKVLSKVERTGVKVDLQSLQSISSQLTEEMNKVESKIRETTDSPNLNVASPKQIGTLLFDKLKLNPRARKGASGNYTTDENTLLELADKSPVIEDILEFRTIKKLINTYIEPFPSYVSSFTGKVHTTFNQALTSTGRLSSSNPNLQNIPIRTERGKEIRKAFIPSTPEGYILSADYSQIELRIMAHLSQDEHLLEAFRKGVDVHSATASKIFGVTHDEVTPEQRRIAKTANFGIMYGISGFGLAQRLRVSIKEANKIINDYFANFPSVSKFIEDELAYVRENGYVETLFGRRRFIPDINSSNATLRGLAERNAINAPIQGTSADIIKIAMINIDKRIDEERLKSKMVLQIHDELVFDAIPDEIDILKKLIIKEMENVIELSIPLTVECNYGKNWLEAH